MSQILHPVKLLTQLSSSNNSGKLQVSSGNVRWNIYIEQGQIKCAANSVQQLMITLDQHLRCLSLQPAAVAAKSIPSAEVETYKEEMNWLEGGRIIPSINWLVLREHLNRVQAKQIFVSLSKEALETYLWLREGNYEWIEQQNLPQHALAARVPFQKIELLAVIQQLESRIRAWQSFGTSILSPYQCPYLIEPEKLTTSSAPILLKLAKFLQGLSFRQLALVLNQDELKIAQLLYPYIQSGELILRSPQTPFNQLPLVPPVFDKSSQAQTQAATTPKLKVACIDDSPTILDEMQRFLAGEIFEVTTIADPVKAAPILLRLKPDLILMDISMPNINGYKLCSFFRGSAALSEIPIIMVSGRTGFIDKTRAKMVGATDYLNKPFSREELVSLVTKHLSKAGMLL